ncbi:MAG: DUF4252 domain-containing protein [Tannerellaceae bacterium]|nr:DUF4252 domain-containing protein [Tannerellaceae bacterium]MCD8265370.1 DUF4252 domain-containing protein [Tannerellaceae bacterium]
MKRKNIFTIIFLICITYCFAQEDVFEKYGNMEQVISLTLPKSMLQMVPDGVADGIDIKQLKEKVESIQILTTQAESIRTQITDDFKNLNTVGYTKLLQAQDKNADSVIWVKENGDIISELVAFSNAKNMIGIVRMKGQFTADDLQQVLKQ